ncbi:MAG: hypothetical protein DMG83_01685 [Acidobacteria bacterium]|nr:MAG: hypothetical protein DMG83_01685 [Acidobacteriota bacterium]
MIPGKTLQEFVERLQVFQAPVLSRPYLAQLSAQFHEPDILPSLFAVLRCSQVRISSVLVRTNCASFGYMRGHLEIKLVNPTKVFSRTPHDLGVDEFLSAQAQVDTRAGGAEVLETYVAK